MATLITLFMALLIAFATELTAVVSIFLVTSANSVIPSPRSFISVLSVSAFPDISKS